MDEVLNLALAVRSSDEIFKGLARLAAAEHPPEDDLIQHDPMPS
jgi:hypothetical protein